MEILMDRLPPCCLPAVCVSLVKSGRNVLVQP